MNTQAQHFGGKSVDRHILEKFCQGVALSQEPHGLDASGSWIAALDGIKVAAYTTALFTMFNSALQSSALNYSAHNFNLLHYSSLIFFALLLAIGWGARSAYTGWSRLEHLHRMLEEERFEIENHRAQEREELTALYQLKGFENPLLDQVIDVLMADSDRLLKVMLEEELGLSLNCHEHPLTQGLWAFLGAFLGGACMVVSYSIWQHPAAFYCAIILTSSASWWQARAMGNDCLNALVWNGTGCYVFLYIASLFQKIY